MSGRSVPIQRNLEQSRNGRGKGHYDGVAVRFSPFLTRERLCRRTWLTPGLVVGAVHLDARDGFSGSALSQAAEAVAEAEFAVLFDLTEEAASALCQGFGGDDPVMGGVAAADLPFDAAVVRHVADPEDGGPGGKEGGGGQGVGRKVHVDSDVLAGMGDAVAVAPAEIEHLPRHDRDLDARVRAAIGPPRPGARHCEIADHAGGARDDQPVGETAGVGFGSGAKEVRHPGIAGAARSAAVTGFAGPLVMAGPLSPWLRGDQADIDPVMRHGVVDIDRPVEFLRIAVSGIGGGGNDGGCLAIADAGEGEGQRRMVAIRGVAQRGVEVIGRGALADQDERSRG